MHSISLSLEVCAQNSSLCRHWESVSNTPRREGIRRSTQGLIPDQEEAEDGFGLCQTVKCILPLTKLFSCPTCSRSTSSSGLVDVRKLSQPRRRGFGRRKDLAELLTPNQ